METKSIKLRRCLRCKYGKQVLQDVITKADQADGLIETENLIADTPCSEQLRKLCKMIERVWFPDEVIDNKYQSYEDDILKDMLTECQMYTDMLMNAEDVDEDESINWKTDYLRDESAIQKTLSTYGWVARDENRKTEIAEMLPTIRKLISDFSRIKYTKQFLDYRNSCLKKKQGEPDVTISPDDCTQLEIVKNSDTAIRYLEEYARIQRRVSKLPQEYQEIFWNTYDRTPTNFGANLTAVMEEKNLTANDVFMLIKPYSKNPKMRISMIQSMMECNFPNKNIDLIPFIARALLVEESVLLSGIGKSWGTFAYQLDTDFMRIVEKQPRGMINKARQEVRKEITDAIRTDATLHDYLTEVSNRENPVYKQLFAAETINLYPDRLKRLWYLRERETLYTLLTCLEDQARKNHQLPNR